MDLDLDLDGADAEQRQEPLEKETQKIEDGPDPTKEQDAGEGWDQDALELDLDGLDELNQDPGDGI